MSIRSFAASAALTMTIFAGTAGSAAGAAPDKGLVAFEQARRAAVAKVDLAAIDRMTDADLTYVDASGFERNKTAYLDHLRTENVVYDSYSLDDLRAITRGNVGVLTGVFRFKVRVGERQNAGVQYFTSVYLRTAGQWKLLLWHPTRATDIK